MRKSPHTCRPAPRRGSRYAVWALLACGLVSFCFSGCECRDDSDLKLAIRANERKKNEIKDEMLAIQATLEIWGTYDAERNEWDWHSRVPRQHRADLERHNQLVTDRDNVDIELDADLLEWDERHPDVSVAESIARDVAEETSDAVGDTAIGDGHMH